MKKILFFCHGAGNGGAERVLTVLANEFSKKENYKVYLVTTNEDKNDYEINSNIERKRIIYESGNIFYKTFMRIYSLRQYVKKEKINCVISFSAIPNMQAIVALLFLKTRLVISERTDPNRYPTSNIGRKLRNFTYNFTDKVVFQTSDAMNYFNKGLKKKSLIIPNPIRDDLPEVYSEKREKKIVGIGSLGEQKNWVVALNACELFFEKHPEFMFEIYGEGPHRGMLQNIIDNSKVLNNRVFLKGFSPNAVEEMSKATMYISSSNYEGISNSMLEALAVGTPTICTDCPVGGARQFINDNENGILIPVGDYVALFEAMCKIAEDKKFAQILSKNSLNIRETLNLKKIINIWERLINEL